MKNNQVLLEKAGSELNDEKALSAVEEFRQAVNSPDGLNNNYHKRVLDVLEYLANKMK